MFYPLELKAGIRPDVVADAYYEDSEMDWLLYLANQIIDPYYQWYLGTQEFQDFINDKYGSFEAAIKTILFWRNNWAGDSNELSVTYFENNIPDIWKHYYSPNWGPNAKILSYSRRREDWTVATNRILQYEVTYTSGNSFAVGETLDMGDGGQTVGRGVVVTSNASSLIVQHVSGNNMANSSWTKFMSGETSNTTATTNDMTTLYDNIANNEAVFWTPITALEYELEQNESKKHIQIIQKTYAMTAAEGVRNTLKG